MSQPIHTPGPVEVVMESDRHVDGAPFKDYFIVTSGDQCHTIADTYNSDSTFTEEDRHGNARLLAAGYNAFDSAAKKLGCNAVELAERMEAAGIAELNAALEGLLERYTRIANSGDAGFWNCEEEPDVIAARAILAKVKGGAS